MKLALGIKVGTSLSLTPQLQQAIRLLQLSTVELEQEIQTQLESNPLLEAIDDQQSGEPVASVVEGGNDTSITLGEQMERTQIGEELPVDTQWDDVYTHQSTALATPEFEEREDNRSAGESVWDQLRWQLNLTPFSPFDRLMAECIIDGIDERGYLIASMEELLDAARQQLEQIGIDPEEIDMSELEVVLKRVQNFDPAGGGGTRSRRMSQLTTQGFAEWYAVSRRRAQVAESSRTVGRQRYRQTDATHPT
jgi:RNA polymerase sigma-54 factor